MKTTYDDLEKRTALDSSAVDMPRLSATIPALSLNPLYDRAPTRLPLMSINAPGAYLRHRAAADRSHRAARRRMWRRRVILLALAVILYFVVGRDLAQLALASYRARQTELRQDSQSPTTVTGRDAFLGRLRIVTETAPPSTWPLVPMRINTVGQGDLWSATIRACRRRQLPDAMTGTLDRAGAGERLSGSWYGTQRLPSV